MPRTDIHSPSNFDPAQYTYVTSFDNWPCFDDDDALREMSECHDLLALHGAKIHFGAGSSQCDHCGARIRYVSVFRHSSGQHIAVGSTCADDRFSCDSRRDYDIKRLKERAANAKERARCFGVAAQFCEEHCPELADWFLSPAAKEVHHIFADMAGRLIKFGSLSEKQLDFARKLLREHFEKQRNGGKTDRQLEIEAEKAKAEDCPTGRTVVTGEVIKTAVQESDFGDQIKVMVKDDRGFVVWMTCPDSLCLIDCTDAEGCERQRALQRGDRITVTATLQPSDRDPKFGFGKRPAKAQVLQLV